MEILNEIMLYNAFLDGETYDVFSLLRKLEKNGETIDYRKGYEYTNIVYSLTEKGYIVESESEDELYENIDQKKYSSCSDSKLKREYRLARVDSEIVKKEYFIQIEKLYQDNESNNEILSAINETLKKYYCRYEPAKEMQQKIAKNLIYNDAVSSFEKARNSSGYSLDIHEWEIKELSTFKEADNCVAKYEKKFEDSVEEYDRIISLLQQIKGWKNSDELLENCEREKERNKSKLCETVNKIKAEKKNIVSTWFFLISILACVIAFFLYRSF